VFPNRSWAMSTQLSPKSWYTPSKYKFDYIEKASVQIHRVSLILPLNPILKLPITPNFPNVVHTPNFGDHLPTCFKSEVPLIGYDHVITSIFLYLFPTSFFYINVTKSGSFSLFCHTVVDKENLGTVVWSCWKCMFLGKAKACET